MAATLTTKFDVGDKVFRAGTTTRTFQHECPDCYGTKEWEATSPAGKKYKFSCPRCTKVYRSNEDLCLAYTKFTPMVEPLTIGSILVDTASIDRAPVSYMCLETGVGSGTIHYESDLFATHQEALAAAEAKAAVQNIQTEWVGKQYDRSLILSDYNLSDAALKSAQDTTIRALVDIDMLFDRLRDCESIREVKGIIDTFEFRAAA